MPNTLTDSPIASHTLAQDQPLMEANNLYFGNTLNVDHQIGPANGTRNDGIAGEGYHKVIHFVAQVADPAPVASTGQVYTKTVGGDQALFFETGGGKIAQLTSAVNPISAATGLTFLPGGLLLQWGISAVNTSGTKTTIAFTQSYSGTAYNVTLTPINNTGSASPSANMVYIDNVTANNFRVTNSATGSITQIYWLAIGPI